jgi:flavin reductase (DIM6/NTAB) family NADH-FMN oxidoreductase RutF
MNMSGLRRCLGQFPTGVTIVAVEARDGSGHHAMTASSFLSVSLEPPLALVSVRLAARMHELLLSAERFTVSVLDKDQENAARRFAGQVVDDEIEISIRAGAPVVEPALATFILCHRRAVEAGDHCLHIGEIERWWTGPGEPLLHFRGAFRRLHDEPEGVGRPTRAWWEGESPW